MPSEDARRYGIIGEEAAGRKWGYRVVGEEKGEPHVDLIAPNGTRYQCKTAVFKTTGGNEGVFRVRREHLEELEGEARSAVILVLLPSEDADSETPLKIVKVSTDRIRQEISHWYPETQDYEIPWSDLIEYP